MSAATRKPTLAVWKFASCDGCQLSLLDCEDELLALAGEVEIAYFLEASRATVKGPYDLSLVEGSVTTAHDAKRIQQVRRSSRKLVTIGACATAGGVQALRNFANVEDFLSIVYASPEYVSTLETSTPISAHVKVDFELNGCPINKRQLLEVITAFLHGRRPNISSTSVCMECKRRGTVCVMVAHGTPCLGPVTHAGCGAICPSYDRGCYGCFGPMETPNTVSLTRQLRVLGMGDRDVERVFRTFNVAGVRGGAVRQMAERRTKTIKTDYLARVEGEGAMLVKIKDGRVDEVKLNIYEPPRFFEAFLRGRAFTRGARHHRPHLRDLPGRVPDELGAGDGAGVRRRGRRPAARPAAAPLLRRVDREPRAARLHAPRARLPRLRERDRARARQARPRRAGARAEEDGQRGDDGRRRPRGASDQRAGRRLVPRAAQARARTARREARARTRDRARTP